MKPFKSKTLEIKSLGEDKGYCGNIPENIKKLCSEKNYIMVESSQYCEGFLKILSKDGQGWIDINGKEFNIGKYQSVQAFSEGYARVTKKDGETLFINKNGDEYSFPGYEVFYSFKNGLSKCLRVSKVSNDSGYINIEGNFYAEALFSSNNDPSGILELNYHYLLAAFTNTTSKDMKIFNNFAGLPQNIIDAFYESEEYKNSEKNYTGEISFKNQLKNYHLRYIQELEKRTGREYSQKNFTEI